MIYLYFVEDSLSFKNFGSPAERYIKFLVKKVNLKS